jgi:hypothetical protein
MPSSCSLNLCLFLHSCSWHCVLLASFATNHLGQWRPHNWNAHTHRDSSVRIPFIMKTSRCAGLVTGGLSPHVPTVHQLHHVRLKCQCWFCCLSVSNICVIVDHYIQFRVSGKDRIWCHMFVSSGSFMFMSANRKGFICSLFMMSP